MADAEPMHIPSTRTRIAGIHIGQGKFSAVWGAQDRMRDVVRSVTSTAEASGRCRSIPRW
jgi:hypothetical protein